MVVFAFVVATALSQPFNPLFPEFETFMKQDGYVLRTAEYSVNSQRGEILYDFVNEAGKAGDVHIYLAFYPGIIDPERYTDHRQTISAYYAPVNLDIPSVKYSAVSYGHTGGGYLIAFVDRGSLRIVERARVTTRSKQVKPVAEPNRTKTLDHVRRMLTVFGPEVSRVAATLNWKTVNMERSTRTTDRFKSGRIPRVSMPLGFPRE